MIDKAKIREFARDATKGDWYKDPNFYGYPSVFTSSGTPEPDDHCVASELSSADAAFIAAANPVAVIELLDECERLERVEKHLRYFQIDDDVITALTKQLEAQTEDYPLLHSIIDDTMMNLDQLRKQRDEARVEVERLTGCLARANANHEDFERRWYLAKDDVDRLTRERDAVIAAGRADGATDLQKAVAVQLIIAQGICDVEADRDRLRSLLREACDLADAHVFAPPMRIGNGNDPVTFSMELKPSIVTIDTGSPYRDKSRIAEIRKDGGL